VQTLRRPATGVERLVVIAPTPPLARGVDPLLHDSLAVAVVVAGLGEHENVLVGVGGAPGALTEDVAASGRALGAAGTVLPRSIRGIDLAVVILLRTTFSGIPRWFRAAPVVASFDLVLPPTPAIDRLRHGVRLGPAYDRPDIPTVRAKSEHQLFGDENHIERLQSPLKQPSIIKHASDTSATETRRLGIHTLTTRPPRRLTLPRGCGTPPFTTNPAIPNVQPAHPIRPEHPPHLTEYLHQMPDIEVGGRLAT